MQKKEQVPKRKSYRLHITNLLFEDGHFARMGPALGAFLFLTDKCTALNEKTGSYDVYGGKFSRKTIPELMLALKKSRQSIWRYLYRLKKEGYITYEPDPKGGVKISVLRIPGGFEKSFGGHSKNGMAHSKNGMAHSKNGMAPVPKSKNQQGIISELQKPPDPNHIKDHIKDHTNKALAAVREILPAASKEEVQKQIQGKDPEKVITWARTCIERPNVQNPPGLFFSELKRRPELFMIDNGKPARKKLPYIFSITPDEVIEIFRKKGLKGQGFENALWGVNRRYKDQICHLSINFDVPKEKLDRGETARMIAIAKEMTK